MNIILTCILIALLVNPPIVLGELRANLVDEFFKSLPYKAFYLKNPNSRVRTRNPISFAPILLRKTDNKGNQLESHLVLRSTVGFSHSAYFYYIPYGEEDSSKTEFVLPNSEAQNFSETNSPFAKNYGEALANYVRIEEFSKRLNEYDRLYGEDSSYSFATELGITLVMTGFTVWSFNTKDPDAKTMRVMGTIATVTGIPAVIIHFIKNLKRDKMMKNLESQFKIVAE